MIINVLNAVTALESRRSLSTLLGDAAGAVSGELSGCLQFTLKGSRRNICVSTYNQICTYLNRENKNICLHRPRTKSSIMNPKVSNESTLDDEDVSMLRSTAATNAPRWWGSCGKSLYLPLSSAMNLNCCKKESFLKKTIFRCIHSLQP